MALIDILNEVARKSGHDLDKAAERANLVDEVNKAAREIYKSKDLPVVLKEVYVRSTANKELALPPFVGELRAIRSGCKDYCYDKWVLHTMYPRYTKVEWVNQWKNWRKKGESPVGIEWTETAPGTITYPVVDEELVITIVGETSNSNRATDNITIDAVSKNWTKTFLNITRIAKNKITDYDVVLTDAAGNECAIIYADQLESRYQLVDVSEYPSSGWGCCACDDGTAIMEVLYKPILPYMYLDTDTFPVSGYDDVIILKTKQLLAEDEEGKEQRALLMDAKASRLIDEISGDKQGHIKRKMSFKRNPYFSRNGGHYSC